MILYIKNVSQQKLVLWYLVELSKTIMGRMNHQSSVGYTCAGYDIISSHV